MKWATKSKQLQASASRWVHLVGIWWASGGHLVDIWWTSLIPARAKVRVLQPVGATSLACGEWCGEE